MTAPVLSIEQQAGYVDRLIQRCTTRDDVPAASATLYLDRSDMEILQALADRLSRMAPFEAEIKCLVTGR